MSKIFFMLQFTNGNEIVIIILSYQYGVVGGGCIFSN